MAAIFEPAVFVPAALDLAVFALAALDPLTFVAGVWAAEPAVVCASSFCTPSASVTTANAPTAHAVNRGHAGWQRLVAPEAAGLLGADMCRNEEFGRKLFTETLGVFSTIPLEWP